MNLYQLPLTTRNFGEWLAALGLLQVATFSGDSGSSLSFDPEGSALLHTAKKEGDLVAAIQSSTDPARITVSYSKEPSKQAEMGAQSSNGLQRIAVNCIGGEIMDQFSHSLATEHLTRGFLSSGDAKYGCIVRFDALNGLSVRHFAGDATVSASRLDSPLKTWSGRIEFHRVLLSIREKVAALRAANLADLLGSKSRETQRFRFDHQWEDYFDDGCCSLEEGTFMRPAVEWLAFLGLSLFPPEAGFASLSPERHRLKTFAWSNPLDSASLTLAIHSGQLTPAAHFQIVVGGQFEPKKIRLLQPSARQPIIP